MRLLDPASVRDTTADPRWQPLRVTAIMGEPVVYYDDGMLLDGPLSWGAYLEYVREHGDDLQPLTPSRPPLDFDLPLAAWTAPLPAGADPHPGLLTADGQIWGWCCSEVEADWVAHGKVEVRKRTALTEMQRFTSAKSHNTALGPLKAHDLAFPTMLAFELRWYALGDRDHVASLLARVSHIGKRNRLGMGRVLSWRVEAMGNRDCWRRRAMPADGGELRSVRAPHHHRMRRAPCR